MASVKFGAGELAFFIYSLYVEMFQDESWCRRFQSLAIGNRDAFIHNLNSYEVYTRASLAVILQHLKNNVIMNWRLFIEILIVMILSDEMLDMVHTTSSHCSFISIYLASILSKNTPRFSKIYA